MMLLPEHLQMYSTMFLRKQNPLEIYLFSILSANNHNKAGKCIAISLRNIHRDKTDVDFACMNIFDKNVLLH